ncbi:aminopeptidase, partial [Bacillus mycoides]|uniref:aminopeptidase n=1 Tax=Bacillus mycoides TaxID=1405 RepID=UPI0011A4D943
MFQPTPPNLQNPLQPCKEHHQTLHKKLHYLNQNHYKPLHYTPPPTHLTIQLPQKHLSPRPPTLNQKNLPFIP